MISLPVLRQGSAHVGHVVRVQNFLLGLGIYDGEADGLFGPKMRLAVSTFQDQQSVLNPSVIVDGVVGNQTWGLLMAAGLDLLEPEEERDEDRFSPHWPPRPAAMHPLTNPERVRLFGRIEYQPAGTQANPEAIRITNDWAQKNIVIANVPQLDRVKYAPGKYGMPGDEKFACHRLMKEKMEALFEAWGSEGLMHLVLTWGGCYVPRFIRGSRTTLSNHSFGTAFDLNVAWNGLGARPALVGQQGSVRELVPLAVQHGFFWGGWYRNRMDGMHFELVRP